MMVVKPKHVGAF